MSLPSIACTSFMATTRDKTHLAARTMDFAYPMHTQMVGFKIGQSFQSVAPDKTSGLAWICKYGSVGPNAFQIPNKVDDGLNNAGLYISMQSLDCTVYPTLELSQYATALEVTDVPLYLLSTCATVEDVEAALKNVNIWGALNPVLKKVPGLHFGVYDANGRSIVVEILDKKLRIRENTLHALTNDPPFEVHEAMFPYANGINNQPLPSTNIGHHIIASPGPGSGLTGLPGSFTSPDRLVKVAKLTQIVFNDKNPYKPKTVKEGEDRIIWIIGQVNVVKGAVLVPTETEGEYQTVYTEWTSMADMTHLTYSFRSEGSTTFRRIDLTKLNFAQGSPPFVPLDVKAEVIGFDDVTQKFQQPSAEQKLIISTFLA